jgi:ATP-dependent DNA helicase RecQ
LKHPNEILEQYWGYPSFRPLQEEIIQYVLRDLDTIALLPTGGGKSICFQIPALIKDGICIVISPLVALISDQVNALKEKGIKALSITGGISFQELNILLDNAIYGNYKFLYISPERLSQEVVQNAIRKMNVSIFAIDEAHCISTWGNDFRPSYKNINILRGLHPLVPYIALTATATPEVLNDTITELELNDPKVIKGSFFRENLSYNVIHAEDKLYKLEKILKKSTGRSIIYVRSRRSAVEYSDQLNDLKIPSTYFHGGISSEEKNERLKQWMKTDRSVMVATNAFGMGIDCPDVRYVIHVQLPDNLENYFQEAGRAGRDGLYSRSIIFYNDHDRLMIKKQFIDSRPTAKDLKILYKTLNKFFQIPYGEGEFEEFSFNFNSFCTIYELNSMLTYNSLNVLDRLGIIQLSKQFGRKSKMKYIASSELVLDYFEKNPTISIIGKTLLRLYGGIFDLITPINLDLLANKTGQSIQKIIDILQKMENDQMIELDLQDTDASITFLVPREDDKAINRISKEVVMLNKRKEQDVASVLRYIDNNKICRSVQLINYFGENVRLQCGICSVCTVQKTSPNKKESTMISEQLLSILEENDCTSRELTESLNFRESKILAVIHQLMDQEKIGINIKNQYYLNQ